MQLNYTRNKVMARHFLYSVFELDVTLVNGNGLEFTQKFLNIGFVRG